MKRREILVLIVLMIVLLTGCGQEAEERNGQPSDSKKTTVTTVPKEAANSDAVKAKATATSTPTPSPVPHLKTAEKPAATNIKDVAHASGYTEEWTDPETGMKCTVIEDLGEDGLTRTMNCFDEDGNLVWWETFYYDYNNLLSITHRMLPDEDSPFHVVVYNRNEDGTLFTMKYIDRLPAEEGTGDYTSCFEEYYLDGKLKTRKTYYPAPNGKVYEEYLYEYDNSGTETYRSRKDISGKLVEEYIDGVKNYIAPDTPMEMLKALNSASDEDFEGLWEACQQKIKDKKLTEKWEELCEAFSCIADGYFSSELYRLREEYGLILFEGSSWYGSNGSADVDALAQYLEEYPASEALRKLIYSPDSHLTLGGTLWLPDEYKAVKGKVKQKERNEDDPIRIFVIDYSKTIMGDTIKRSMLLEDTYNVGYIIDRAEAMIDGLFEDYTNEVCLTSYPDLADVILEIRTEYPYAGKYYYSDGTPAKVWNISITLKAINQRGKGETSATFKNIAGDTVSVYGGTEIYMEEPDLNDDEYCDKSEKFAKTVLSWFGR